jgi:GntR family transcriptional regulator
MEIQIDDASEVSIRDQLAEQIVFSITTGRLAAGQPLPSVREVARRLKIHHNTVSSAYQDLVRRKWVSRRRGSRLVVSARETMPPPQDARSLDDLINLTIRMAQILGYSLQSLRERVRARLMAEPPDHILVVEQETGLREIMRDEIQTSMPWPVKSCSRDELAANPGLAVGALAVTTQHAAGQVDPLLPEDRPVVPVNYASADEQLKQIRALRQPSTIAVVSASAVFLSVARSLIASAAGSRHSLREILLPQENASISKSADLIFCDSIARRAIRSTKVVHYRLITAESLNYLASAMKSYEVRLRAE